MLGSLDEPGRDDNEIFYDELRSFVVTHDTSVTEQVRAMNADRVATDVWDPHTDVLSLDLSYGALPKSIASTLSGAALHNALFHRTVLVLASMNSEMRALSEEMYASLLPPLALFGDPDPVDGDMTHEAGVVGLGKLIPHLMDIWNWHTRIKSVVKLFLRQMASLYDDLHTQTKFAPYQAVDLEASWFAFFDLLGSAAVLEEVLQQHEQLHASVTRYMRVMEQVKRHPERYDDANTQYIEEFGRLVVKVDNDLLQGRLFYSLHAQRFDARGVAKVTDNESVFRRVIVMYRRFIGKDVFVRRFGRSPYHAVCCMATFVFLSNTFRRQFDGDSTTHMNMVAATYGLHQVVPIVPLLGSITLRTAAWFTKKMHSVIMNVTKDPQKDTLQSVQDECRRIGGTFEIEMRRMKLSVTSWQARMQSTFSQDRDKGKQLLNRMTDLLLIGVKMAYRIQHMARLVIAAFDTAQQALSLRLVDAIHLSVDLLTTIRHTYHAKSRFIASLQPILLDHHAFEISHTLYDMYKRLTEELQRGSGGLKANVAEGMTDQQCAVGQALSLLSRPMDKSAVTCMELVLHIAFHRSDSAFAGAASAETIDRLLASFELMKALADHQRAIREATDCDFLYWQREALVPLFIRNIAKQPATALRLRTLIFALHDSIGLMLTARHVKKPQELVDKFDKYVHSTLDSELIRPLCIAIEEDLRVHAHAVVTKEPYKNIKGYELIQLFGRLTRLPSMRFFGRWYSVREQVENFLEENFYLHNALHPYDGRTYDQMRTQARERFGLEVTDAYLPGSISDQGLDVLVVTKNIHVFVANYVYNLNEQLFVQRPTATDGKHLNTLHIRHVANSIRIHGTGIMNTTVNYVYKCLLKKLSSVSQFLFDDHIRSKLLKDIKYFNGEKQKLQGKFPVKRAEKFANEVRKLGVTEDNRSYLDQFRELVAEIGNALGYMRMVRSGGLRCLAEAAGFIPHVDQVPVFEKICDPNVKLDDDVADVGGKRKKGGDEDDEEEDDEEDDEELDFMVQVSPETQDAIRLVDKTVGNMTKRLSDGSDYLHMLQKAIKRKLMDPKKYGHLRHFYMIVPSLCMSHVDTMIHQKERLMKKNKEGLFTDDGFALGCVFLLALFSRNPSDFDSLHWFESVVEHYHAKRAQTRTDLSERIEQSRRDGDTMASQTIQLTLSMVESSLAEYSGLHQTFNCCRVFFQSKYRGTSSEQHAANDEEEEEGAEPDEDEEEAA